ncbi:LiaF transmembrane domain-containing protein [Simiduia agarivorans]|uniref:Heavy metal efflux pump CzcA n=1 Tax=Simiduia agarivorans (strain DSM 21679 / JCM 13881 / BCRC 17597 / SA1) TaxID=1117647 RepID=K4KJY1_SIMAS|nr:LiaF domain-containing protein [Simiduia agarivorans]AFU98540.1 heavy metal efflux pump CzcA [Simiduia agarivorans SA1 = DSM 21679]
MSKDNKNLNPRSLFGIGLIVFAVLLFLSNIGIPLLGMILRHWPVLLIILGAVMLHHQKENPPASGRKYLPHGLIAAGIVFQLANLHVLSFGVGAILVPMALLFVGFHLVRPGSKNAQANPFGQGDIYEGELADDGETVTANTQSGDSDKAKIDVFTLLGGGHYSTRSQKLVGGNATAILGGVEIDIREADSQANTIELDVMAVMGGVEIKVPPHFSVSSNVLPILGGVTNTTTCLADKLGVPQKHLVINGLALMGGVEITN